MTPETTQAAAELLLKLRGDHRKIDQLPEEMRPADPEEGFQVQSALADLWGLDVAGWKIGCTTVEAMTLLGTDAPFPGRVFAPYLLESPATVSHSAFHLVGSEGEFAFGLGKDLPARAAPYERAEVEDAVDALYPAIEIVNYYWNDWGVAGVHSIIADNGAGGGLVLGQKVKNWRDLDLAAFEVFMTIDGKEVGRGTGSMVLGEPMNAMTWLANYLPDHGIGLRAGQVITTGTMTSMNPIPAGSVGIADFGPLGRVQLTVTD